MNYANYFCTIWEVGAFLLGKLARIYSTTCSSEASTKHSLFKLCPKLRVILIFSCLLLTSGIFLNKPSEVLRVVDLFAVGGEESLLLNLFHDCVYNA